MSPELLTRTGATTPSAAGERTARGRWSAGRWWLAAAILLSLVVTVRDLGDADAYWRLALGRLITGHGLPGTEPFSFQAAAHPWVAQGWLTDVLISRLWALAGAGLTMLAFGIAGSSAVLAAALAVPQRAAVPALARAAAVVAGAVVRSQTLGVLGLALCLLLLSRWREGSTRAVWLLAPLMLLWANLDAGFVIGLVAVTLTGLAVALHRRFVPGSEPGARLRPLGLALLLATAATLATPAGIHLYGSLGENLAGAGLGISGWQSPAFHTWPMRLVELEALTLVVLWTAAGRLDPVDAALGLAALVATLYAQGTAAAFTIVALPQIARYGTLAAARYGPRVVLPAVALALIAAAVAAVVAPRLNPSHTAGVEAATEPVAAAGYVAAHLAGDRLYSAVEWGGYLAERFPDGRVVDAYGPPAAIGQAAQQRYLDVHDLRADWRTVLREDGVTHAVLPQGSREVAALEEVGWHSLCHDAAAGAVVIAAGPMPAPDAPIPDATAAPAC
ncbi:MAG: hypothetical protein E6I76_02635 [Chloroflexi bacterium]|nr:MAG: hypothetical protein E6I76_02635 [Chloroflexota bacterium]